MKNINRREFIKWSSVALALAALPHWPEEKDTEPAPEPPPTSLGRITTWWRHALRTEPDAAAEWVAWKTRDEIIPLHAAISGKPPWPGNPIWYQTDDGFIHSGYVQPVENDPQSEIVSEVAEPGFWSQVCVPIAEARWRPDSARVRYKLYYGTVYRVIGATEDDEGNWWYQLKDGITYAPGPYVPTWSVRRIPPEEMAPISPGHPDKWIEINLSNQRLTCFEGQGPVFITRISSGAGGTTPRGEYRVLYKRHTRRMVGGAENDRYDLPGVAFPVYYTWSAIAIHGTYWHNDFVRPHSHGCINVSNQAAQWIFRWTDPIVPYDEYERKVSKEDSATRIVVV
ncbi:MAG TPA: hypothetical protein ENN19_18600 [Chloroflexi bacterium]|nr:hypothetical protein [Chloroflexota bacterium]